MVNKYYFITNLIFAVTTPTATEHFNSVLLLQATAKWDRIFTEPQSTSATARNCGRLSQALTALHNVAWWSCSLPLFKKGIKWGCKRRRWGAGNSRSVRFLLYHKTPISNKKPRFTCSNLAADFFIFFLSSFEQSPKVQKQNSAATAELSAKAQSLINVIFLSPGLRNRGAGAVLPLRHGRLQAESGSLTPPCHRHGSSFIWPRLGGRCSAPGNSWSRICQASWARHTMLCHQLPLFMPGPSQPAGRAATRPGPALAPSRGFGRRCVPAVAPRGTRCLGEPGERVKWSQRAASPHRESRAEKQGERREAVEGLQIKTSFY